MTLDEYIKLLEELKKRYSGDIKVIAQTLTHRFAADPPIIRMGNDDKPFVLINP